jgi:hypothetical protein
MDRLISKLQYKFYEIGEFSGEQLRTLEETISLIRNFPWEEQRTLISVDLTGPSVTIQGIGDTFLKIGHYYYNQFCAYLYTTKGKCLKCRALELDEAMAIVTDFFNAVPVEQRFEPSFRWFSRKHFVTKPFVYKITLRRALWFMLWTICFSIPFTVLLALAVKHSFVLVMLVLPLWLLFGGMNWLLFFNYYLYSGRSMLRVAKGEDTFIYGTADTAREYSKKDITSFTVYANEKMQRCPWTGFEVYVIKFANGDRIVLNSLLISSYTIGGKFSTQFEYVNKSLPFISKKYF